MNWIAWLITAWCWYLAALVAIATVIATYDGLRGLPFQKRIALTIGIGGTAGVTMFMFLAWLWSAAYLGYADE